MVETRRQPDTRAQRSDTAAAIAAALMAGEATVAGLAALLLSLLPKPFLLAAPEQAAQVAEEAAKIVLTNPPGFALRREVGEFERRASLENLLLRGFYAVSAVRRLVEAVSSSSNASVEDTLKQALVTEGRHLQSHRDISKDRIAGAKIIDAAIERWGTRLSWNHSGNPIEPRSHHLAAHGKTFDIRKPPIQTGGLPGTLPNCGCTPGPPRPGAQMLF